MPGVAAPDVHQAVAHPPVVPPSADDKFAAVKALPYFREMKAQIKENPASIRDVLARVQADNPDLLQVINSNIEEFTALLNQPDSEMEVEGDMDGAQFNVEDINMLIGQLNNLPAEDRRQALQRLGLTEEQFQSISSGISAGMGGAGGFAPRPQRINIELTTEENAVIDRVFFYLFY